MKFGHMIWLGTEESFFKYQALEDKYFGQEPQAFRHDDDAVERPEFDETFGVRADRIGLNLLEKHGSTTFLKVYGTLTDKHQWWHAYFPGEITSYEALADALDIVVKDESKSRVVMDFATGGGLVRGLDNASRKIRWARNFVQLDAHTDSSAFSAGYWLASSARRITASRMAEVGSIGTLLITYSMVRAAADDGIDYRVFRAGEFKALGNPYEELTEKAAEHIQENLEKTNAFFLEHVSLNRNLLMSDQKRWGEGKTFFADDAVKVGLLDEVTTLDELLGGGASHTSTSDNRRLEMTISEEKLAQIAAGADPKEVLTAEELKHYEASLAEEQVEEPVQEEAEAEENAPAAVAATGTGTSAEILALTKEVGRLEAKLEAAEAKAEALQGQFTAKETETVALMEVAKVALGNLCMALGKPKELPTSAAGITAKFTELQGEMASRFKTGQQSAATLTGDDAEQSVTSFRHQL